MSSLDASARPAEAGGGLGVVRVAGSDARSFLQGQLSNDLRLLERENSQLAALNSPQGRVIAILRLIERADGIHALLPRSMTATVFERLRKYVLRAKVTLTSADELDVVPLTAEAATALGPVQLPPHAAISSAVHFERGPVSVLQLAGPIARALLVGPRAAIDELLAGATITPGAWNDWRLALIAAGEPQIHPPTREQFVAQMLNLDLIDGISFTKGCYTGQEIIARTHHLGRIKRRMIRARHAGAAVSPGEKLFDGEQIAGEVVESAATRDESAELLAVIQRAHGFGSLHLADARAVTVLSLPYAVDTG